MVKRILEESKIPPKALILELTESCKVVDPNGLQDDFEYFKNMGINMALDDFGTEYSSIALLRKLKPQWIKIDHTFVRSIQDDEMDQAILEYITNLCKQTKIKVCVEGVENAGNSFCCTKLPARIASGLLFFQTLSARGIF